MTPFRRQAIIWTNTGLLSIGLYRTNFSENLIDIYTFKEMLLNMSSGKWRPFRLGFNGIYYARQTNHVFQLVAFKLPPSSHFLKTIKKNTFVSRIITTFGFIIISLLCNLIITRQISKQYNLYNIQYFDLETSLKSGSANWIAVSDCHVCIIRFIFQYWLYILFFPGESITAYCATSGIRFL